ncbi:MAG: proline--tRNA ligase [Thermoplasmataceae archaeon]
MAEDEGITVKKGENFSEWYTQVLIKSEFFDYGDVSGTTIFRPYGYYVWERIQSYVDELFKADGISNTAFPLLIPKKFLEKEKEHIEGFSPEVAWVTRAGQSKLEEELAIRPTSETIMYPAFSRWIRSWRDLPLRYNQWNNVVRWEFKHPTPLLRNREFLWNEGHSVFADGESANDERDRILGIYEKTLRELLCLQGIKGRKTESEKFAGGVATYSFEFLLPDGRNVQGPDFHHDGTNFARAFDIAYLNKTGEKTYVFQNTYAISTRMLGVLLAVHGDDKGLVVPPGLSRYQVIIVPIYNEKNKVEVLDYCRKIHKVTLGSYRTHLDERSEYTPGWKYNYWELKGIPIRFEVGMREVKQSHITYVRRDTMEKGTMTFDSLNSQVDAILKSIGENLLKKSSDFLYSHIKFTDNLEEMKSLIAEGNMAQANWCGKESCEKKIKDASGGKSANMPLDISVKAGSKCVCCKEKAGFIVNFGKSY